MLLLSFVIVVVVVGPTAKAVLKPDLYDSCLTNKPDSMVTDGFDDLLRQMKKSFALWLDGKFKHRGAAE